MTHNSFNSGNTTCNHPANHLIEAVAFGFASDSDVKLVNDHVEACEICTQALSEAQFAVGALPLSVDEMDVPESVWAGIEQRIQVDEPPAPDTVLVSPASRSRATPFNTAWAVAALLAVISLAAGILLGRTVFDPGPEPAIAPMVDVSITDPEISATGSVHYFADQGVILLDLENLPPAPEGQVYQVWMIEGDTPISVGILPATNRFAAAGDPANFDLLAITVEEGPIGSGQPTTDPLAVADLEPLRDD